MKRREILKMVPAAAGAILMPSAFAVAPTSTGGSARIKSALCAYSYREQLESGTMSYEDLVDVAVEHGIDGLDLTVYWLPKTGMDEHLLSLRRKAYLAAVEIPAIAIRSNLCKGDDQQQQMEVAWLSHWVCVLVRLLNRQSSATPTTFSLAMRGVMRISLGVTAPKPKSICRLASPGAIVTAWPD